MQTDTELPPSTCLLYTSCADQVDQLLSGLLHAQHFGLDVLSGQAEGGLDGHLADGTLDRASMATITNPDDLNALEAALKLKDATGCEVVVVTMEMCIRDSPYRSSFCFSGFSPPLCAQPIPIAALRQL